MTLIKSTGIMQITGPPNFYRHNLFNIQFIYTNLPDQSRR